MDEVTVEASPKPVYAQTSGGVARELTQEQVQGINQLGGLGQFYGKPISKEQALGLAQQEHDLAMAHEQGGAHAALLGALQGASFGLAAPAILKYDEMFGSPGEAQRDRHLMAGEQQKSSYVPGQVAGMLAATAATGGLFNPIESAVGRLIPESADLLGTIGRGAATLGARGGIEGTVMGFGNAVEEASIQNKPLAAEAVLAKMVDGGLLGAGIGAAFGGASGAIRGIRPGVQGVLKSAMARIGGRTSAMPELEGVFLKEASGQLEKEGLTLSSEPAKVRKVAQNNITAFGKVERATVKEFDRAATGAAPSWNAFNKAVQDEIVAPTAMSPGGLDSGREVNAWLKKLAPEEIKSKGGFEQWASRRSAVANAASSLPKDTGEKLLAMYDSHMKMAMEAAEGLDTKLAGGQGRYSGAVAGRRVAEELEGLVDKKIASTAHKSLGASALEYAVGGGSFGGLAKKFGQQIAASMWSMNAGANASLAVTEMKDTIGKAVGLYLKGRDAAGITLAKYGAAQKKVKLTRESYDSEVNDAYARMGRSSEDRVKDYMRATNSLALAQAMGVKSDNTMNYIQKNITPVKKHPGTLRPVPVSKTLDVDEHKFLLKYGPIKNPYSIFSDLGSNKLSTESVKSLQQNWPELYGQTVQEVQSQIAQMKVDGETLPMEKITQLSILLDTPLDSTLERPFIQEIQMALNAPDEGQPAPGPQGPPPMGPPQIDAFMIPSEKVA